MGVLFRDLCKIIFGLVRKLVVLGNFIGDRLVRELVDIDLWLRELIGFRLGKVFLKIKREERDK